jgi:hypothetical protein
MQVERIKLGTPVTAHSAATSLPFLPTSYADVSSWEHNRVASPGSTKAESYPYAEMEIFGSTTIAGTALRIRGLVLDSATVSGDTFTTTHADNTFTQSSHGFLMGDGPIRLTNSGGALPAGVSTDTNYYIYYVDANTFKVSTSRANAYAGTVVDITGDGTGTHSYATYTSGATVFQRGRWLNFGLIGELGDGAVALTVDGGYITRFNHSPRVVGYALVGTLDTGNVTVKFRPGWLAE